MTQAVAEPQTLPLARVRPADLGLHWPLVEAGLQQCMTRCGADDWTPQDVHARIMDESFALYVRREGFMVLEQCSHAISRKRYLNVWAAWFQPAEAKKRMHILIGWLDALQAANACAWWQFQSPVDGWDGLKPFCKAVTRIWRRV